MIATGKASFGQPLVTFVPICHTVLCREWFAPNNSGAVWISILRKGFGSVWHFVTRQLVGFCMDSVCKYKSGTRFTKPQNADKPREVSQRRDWTLKLSNGSEIWQGDRTILIPYLAASTLCENCWWDVFTAYWTVTQGDEINSLRRSDAEWRHIFWPALSQVMNCCLVAPSHYPNQCWLIIKFPWHYLRE